jgi:hypothetical protein
VPIPGPAGLRHAGNIPPGAAMMRHAVTAAKLGAGTAQAAAVGGRQLPDKEHFPSRFMHGSVYMV